MVMICQNQKEVAEEFRAASKLLPSSGKWNPYGLHSGLARIPAEGGTSANILIHLRKYPRIIHYLAYFHAYGTTCTFIIVESKTLKGCKWGEIKYDHARS